VGLFSRNKDPLRIHVLVRGRIGEGWVDLDETVRMPEGATLGALLARTDAVGNALRDAVAHSPHLSHTLMWNGERRPVEEHRDRPLADGDQIYLLAPLAGG